jgi:hypothetical protein
VSVVGLSACPTSVRQRSVAADVCIRRDDTGRLPVDDLTHAMPCLPGSRRDPKSSRQSVHEMSLARAATSRGSGLRTAPAI